MRIKGAIFDVDGTLLDSMYVWRNISTEYLKHVGIPVESDIWDEISSLTLRQAAELFIGKYPEILHFTADEVMQQINDLIVEKYFYEVKAKPGVGRFLEELRKKGVKMCLATATDRYLVEAALRREGLLEYFGKVFTCTEFGSGKDKPDIFLAASDWLGTRPEETMVFEDAHYAIRTAVAAHFPVTAVADSFEKRRDEISAMAERYIESFLSVEAEDVIK